MTLVTQLMLLFLIVCAIDQRHHLYGLFDDYVHHLDYARIA